MCRELGVQYIRGKQALTSGIAQTNFYRYLFDPTNYVFQENIKTISKADEEKYNEMAAEFDKNNSLQVTYYKNGRDVNIVYSSNKDDAKESESVARIPETVPSKAQDNEYESRDEGRCQAVQEEKIND